MKTSLALLAACGAAALAAALPANAQTSPSGTPNQLRDAPSAFVPDARRAAWHAEVERTERGFRIGNPDAEASLIEFVSYTCGHCATFTREGEGALDLALLAPGHLNLEVRPVIRNAIDLTISLLVACQGPERFKDSHRLFMMRQDAWMKKVTDAPASQQAIWARGDRAARVAMAQALDFDDMLANRGASLVDLRSCLNDDNAARALIASSNADRGQFAVTGTPSFALDGELLDGVHNWAALYPVLEARFRPDRARD
ncbi:DsbA family protein [Qipengyuania nanhaisediminis]|uniref:DsbA family protein n=1 Tax=Qipengyuania nanhaisediminis TaxID=604088 RepID=UPI0038B39369